jgi:putative phosphoserine phosphatase/1-acylglycerol-3-phosphate O-acyltransferase
VAGRNAAKLNPGTVDIAVLPPVSVENWSLRNLRERIEQVRAAYLATQGIGKVVFRGPVVP